MSLVDELRRLEAQVTRRLSELEPLVAEYDELRGIAERLGSKVRSTPAPAARRTTRTSRSSAVRRTRQSGAAKRGGAAKRAAAPKPAPAAKARPKGAAAERTPAKAPAAQAATNGGGARGGKRDAEIVRLVTAKPGITVAEVGKQLRVDPTGLYRVVRRLESAGQIKKSGTGLTPAATK
jgi:hypothetical protein